MIKKLSESMNKRIDIVYIWVDWADPVWKEKRKNAYSKASTTSVFADYANVEGRFRDNQELKYSLRSIEKYFPNHWNIFIITDNQVPKFLRHDANITIISHADFIPEDFLPTFSSRKINAFIPFIQDISENFLLFNDDVFIWPKFSISDFIDDEKTIYYFIPKDSINITESFWYSNYTLQILQEKYPKHDFFPSIPAHTPRIVNKKEYIKMTQEFSFYFDKLSHETFRERENSSFLWDLYGRWMIHNNKWIIWWDKWLYLSTSNWDYTQLLKQFHDLPFFCINDTSDNKSDDSGLKNIAGVLDTLFPEKSCFEI